MPKVHYWCVVAAIAQARCVLVSLVADLAPDAQVKLPDFITMQRYAADVLTGVADAATIIICGVDESTQEIPGCASHLVPQVAIPAWLGNKLNGEPHMVLFLPFTASIAVISSACGSSQRLSISNYYIHLAHFAPKTLTNTRFLDTLFLLLIVGLETRFVSMATLEELRPGVHLKGLLPGKLVTLIEVKPYGTTVAEVTYKDASGLPGTMLLYQQDAARLEIVSHGVLMPMARSFASSQKPTESAWLISLIL
jgi:hypothetical protein